MKMEPIAHASNAWHTSDIQYSSSLQNGTLVMSALCQPLNTKYARSDCILFVCERYMPYMSCMQMNRTHITLLHKQPAMVHLDPEVRNLLNKKFGKKKCYC